MQPYPISARGARLAYALSSTATLLWFACVLPAGRLAAAIEGDDATPMHREPWLLVGALFLLIVMPVGVTLAREPSGQRAVLSATDAFVALYAAVGVTLHRGAESAVAGALVGLLYLVGLLSVFETVRLLGQGAALRPQMGVRGLRLGMCMLALLMPSGLLMQEGQELASLLAPFAFVALSALGSSLSQSELGLRLTATLLQLALALHVGITLRWVVLEGAPALVTVGPMGWTALALALLAIALALAQVLRRMRRLKEPEEDAAPHASPHSPSHAESGGVGPAAPDAAP